MSRTLSEQQILNKLNISSFRNLSKKGIVDFVSNLPQLDPEVAKKALEQVPYFTDTAKETLKQMGVTVDAAMKSNDASVNVFYSECHYAINILEKQLNRPDLSKEERTEITNGILSILEKLDKKDTEHRQSNENLVKYLIGGAVIVFGGILTVIGIDSHWGNSSLSA